MMFGYETMFCCEPGIAIDVGKLSETGQQEAIIAYTRKVIINGNG